MGKRFIRVSVCSVRVVEQSSVFKSMGFIYLNKFTYLNTFMIKPAHKCLGNGGATVTANVLLKIMFLVSCPTCVGIWHTPKGTLSVHLSLTLLGIWAHWSHGWHCYGPSLDRSTFVVPSRFGVLVVFILPLVWSTRVLEVYRFWSTREYWKYLLCGW